MTVSWYLAEMRVPSARYFVDGHFLVGGAGGSKRSKVHWKGETGLVSVFTSLGCCHKLPQTSWLKTTGTYSVIVLETRIPKQFCGAKNQGVAKD